MEPRHCRAALSAGHQTSSCCRLALLTNRAARCCWWGSEKPWAFGRQLWDIKLGGGVLILPRQRCAHAYLVVYMRSSAAEKIFSLLSELYGDLPSVTLLLLSLCISVGQCASLFISQCESQSLQSISPTAPLILR